MSEPDLDTTPPEAEPVAAEPVQPDVPEPDWPASLRKILDKLEQVQRARALVNGSSEKDAGLDYPVAQGLLEALENGLKAEFATELVRLTMDSTPGWDPHAR
jgi:hypothetical protein